MKYKTVLIKFSKNFKILMFQNGLNKTWTQICENLDRYSTRYQTESGSGMPNIDIHGDTMESNKYKMKLRIIRTC